MRSVFVSALLLLFALACAAQSKPQRQPRNTPVPAQRLAAQQQFQQDQKAIARLQQEEIAANIAFDTEKLLALYTDDAVLIPPEQPEIRGKEALRAYYEQAKKELGNTEILGYDESWDEVQVAGDWALQWGTITKRTRPANSEKETTSTARAMRLLKRQPEGAWLVARALWNHPAVAPPPPPPK